VRDDDDEASLAARVLEAEHRLLPQVVGWYCAGQLVIDRGGEDVKGNDTTSAALARTA
jgi:phosphoribosylglycinamide formyltransferase-1